MARAAGILTKCQPGPREMQFGIPRARESPRSHHNGSALTRSFERASFPTMAAAERRISGR